MSAISQIQVNKILVGYTCFVSKILEVVNDICAQPDGNLFFQSIEVRIPARVGKIVIIFHDTKSPYCFVSGLVAFRTEMSRITDSDSR